MRRLIKMAKVKKKAKTKEAKTSVKTYQRGIATEKQKTADYSKKFGTTVKSLQTTVKSLQKEVKEAALNMVEEGRREMHAKVNQFKADTKAQIKENKNAVEKIGAGIKFFRTSINGKKMDFRAYTKAFWG